MKSRSGSVRLVLTVIVLAAAALALKLVDASAPQGLWSSIRDAVGLGGDSGGAVETTWCPMDPQIVRRGPGTCPICNMELVPFEEGTAGESGVLVLSDRQVQQAGVRLGSARVRDLAREIDATGRLEVDPGERASVLMPFPGASIVEEVHVLSAGTRVGEGTVLLEVQNSFLIDKLKTYRAVVSEFSNYRRRQLEGQAQSALNRMNQLRREFDAAGLDATNLNFFASSPKFQFTDPAFPIYSPIRGAVLNTPDIFVGDRLNQNQLLYEIADLNELWLYVDLYEHELPLVAVGQTIRFFTHAVPDKEFRTTIRFIEPLVRNGTQTVRAQARVPNPLGELAPGMFVRAEIACPVPEVLSVPDSAVLQSGRRNVVIVSEGDGRFRPRIVDVGRRHLVETQTDESGVAFGPSEQRYHEIKGGVRAGERVVMAGNFLLNAEAQFQGVLAKMVEAHEAKENAQALEEASLAAMEALLSTYYDLGDALVMDELEGAVRAGDALVEAAGSPDVAGSAAEPTFQSLETAGKALVAAARATEPDWDAIRTHYGSVSREVVGFLRQFAPQRVSEGELFLFRCPMADDFGFELWVQAGPDIANPYMGQMMPECGGRAELD